MSVVLTKGAAAHGRRTTTMQRVRRAQHHDPRQLLQRPCELGVGVTKSWPRALLRWQTINTAKCEKRHKTRAHGIFVNTSGYPVLFSNTGALVRANVVSPRDIAHGEAGAARRHAKS